VKPRVAAVLQTATSTLLVAALLIASDASSAAEKTTDAHRGNSLRVVTLAPSLAELMFAAQAGDQLVAVSAFTDYPQAAAKLPVISDAFVVDEERLAMLKPDLLLAW